MGSNVPIRAQFLGIFHDDPGPTAPGQWWFNSTEGGFKFFTGTRIYTWGGTYRKMVSIPADEFGRPNTNPPDIIDQDNLTLYEFTLNTDRMTHKFPVPSDYGSGDLEFMLVWTNDGGTDDNGKNVKWQMDYQIAAEGDQVSGSHSNSPKTVEDTYESDQGWIEHHTGTMKIPASEFAGKLCIYLKISAVTPSGTALTCEPHLMGLCFIYTAAAHPAYEE